MNEMSSLGKFHHIGYATSTIEKDLESYTALGFTKDGDFFTDPIQKIKGVFLRLGDYRLELLAPLSEDSPINGFINKKIKMYHHGFTVNNFDEAMIFLKNLRAILLSPPAPSVAFNGKRIAFFMLKNRDIVEIIET
ncbi:VOC family protein [Bdellovibrio sp. HCB209]|uniref:VOC family protein n=1 Tax=Bdellovibrio sp. HCB209 TaxID=3394354 RepID=UPI0039B5DAAB